MCLRSTFSGLLGSTCLETVLHRAVFSGGSDLLCAQHDQPNEALIASRWCRCWKEKPKLKLRCQDVILPCDAENLPQTGRVKVILLLYMPLRSSPHFTAIKESGKNDSSVYLDLGGLQDASLIPHIPVESVKGCTCFCESGIHLVIHDNRLREGAAKVSEFFYHLWSLSLNGDVGLDIWLVHHLCLFCADG